VCRNEPSSLCLHMLPEVVVSHPAPALIKHGCRVVSVRPQQLSDLRRQVFVHFEPSGHYSPSSIDGIISASLATAAANFSAALMSSGVSCGQDSMIRSGVCPSAMLPTITLTGTRVPLMHGLPW